MRKKLWILICVLVLAVGVAMTAVACGDDATLNSIEIDEDSIKTVFTEGETVDLEGALVVLTYSNGKTEVIELTQSMLSGEINTKSVGPHTLRVTYNDRSCLLRYTVVAAAKPSNVAEVKLEGVQTEYKLNDKISYEGTLVATFTDGVQLSWALADIKNSLTINGFKTDREGSFVCQLSYDPQIYDVLTVEYTYTVAPLSPIATAVYGYESHLRVFQYQTKDDFLTTLNEHPFLFTYEDGTSAEVYVQNAGQIDRSFDSQTLGDNFAVAVSVTDSHLRNAKVTVQYEVRQRFTQYTVTFDPACEDMSPISVQSSEETGKVEQQEFNRPGYQCRGWYVDSVDGTRFDFNSVVSANTTLYARWQLQHYSIRITSFGSTYTYQRTFTVDDAPFALEAPTTVYDGYEFVGYEATKGVYENDTVNPARYAGDLELIANWRPIAYTLTYDLQDDEAHPVNDREAYLATTYTTQDTAALPSPNRDGYTFAGWSTNPNGGDSVTTMRLRTGNTVLYAIWTPNTYYITYVHAATGNVLGTKSFSINTQNTAIMPANVPGYRFEGWYTDEACTVEFYKNNGAYVLMRGAYTNSFNLYAKTTRVYTLYLARDEGNTAITFAIGEEDSADYLAAWRQASVGVNCDLRYWQYVGEDMPHIEVYVVDNDGNDHVSITTATLATYEGKTFYPVWKGHQRSITYHYGYDEIIETDTYDTYEGKTLLIPTRNGYYFDGWRTDDSNLGVYKVESRSTDLDLVFYAKWRVREYTLTFHYNIAPEYLLTTIRGTSAKVLTKVSDVEYTCRYKVTDDVFNFSPLPTAKFHRFEGWYTTQDGVDGVELTALDGTYDVTDLWAQWTPTTYRVAFRAADGKDFVLDESQQAEVNCYTDALTLSVPTRQYYTFGGWYLDSALSQAVALVDGQYVLSVADLFDVCELSAAEGQTLATVYAKWTADRYTLTFGNGKIGKTTISTTNNPNLADGATAAEFSTDNVLTLRAAEATCYDFLGWYKSLDYGEDELVTTTVDLHADTTLYPLWQLHEYTITYYGLNDDLVAELGAVTTYTLGDSKVNGSTSFSNNVTKKLQTRFGYTLENGKVYSDVDRTVPVTSLGANAAACADVVLYTGWTTKTYTINLKSMPRTGTTTSNYTAPEWGDYKCTITVENVSALELPIMRLPGQVPQEDWYTATNLSDSSRIEGRRLTVAQMKEIYGTKTSITLYGKFEQATYNLQYVFNMADIALAEDAPTTYNYFDGVTLPAAPEVPEGYRWVGWYLEQDYTGDPITAFGIKQMTGDKTLWGRIERKRTITYSLEGATCAAVTDETAPTAFSVGEATTLPAPTYTGYTFSGWYTASLGNVGTKLPMGVDADVTLVPLFYNSSTAGLTVAYRQDGKGVVTAYTGTGTSITLPTKMGTANVLAELATDVVNVVEVGAKFLYQNTKVTSITVPNGYLYISAQAFLQSNLGNSSGVTLPESIVSIGDNAFNGSSIQKVTLSGGTIGQASYVFANCTKLTTVSMTNCVVADNARAFYNCPKLTTVTLVGTGYGVGTLADATALDTLKVDCGSRLITLFGAASNAASVATTFNKLAKIFLLKDSVPTAAFASGIAYLSQVTSFYFAHTDMVDVSSIPELLAYLNADGRTVCVANNTIKNAYIAAYGWTTSKVIVKTS